MTIDREQSGHNINAYENVADIVNQVQSFDKKRYQKSIDINRRLPSIDIGNR